MITTPLLLLAITTPLTFVTASPPNTAATTTGTTMLRRTEAMTYQAVMTSVLPLFCQIENGFDYVGNDIANVRGPVDSCCGACERTTGCEAWSWSDYNGGTCWLKSARGTVIVNPRVKSAQFFYQPRPRCALTQDYDFVGNDLARVDSKTADGCCDLCHNYLGCRAYTWSDYNGGSCWLKSSFSGQVVYKPGVKSAEAYPVPDPTCAKPELDTDYVDNDLGFQSDMPDPTRCCELCRSGVDQCRAYSWTSQNGGTCYFKSGKGRTITKPGVKSAQVWPNVDAPCATVTGVDYVGNDLTNTPGANAAQCCTICRKKYGCRAFSWTNLNGGTCWLKTGKAATIANAAVTSGVI